VALGAPGYSAETVYPAGSAIDADYQLSGTTLSTGDTLVIFRSVANGESFALTGLYLSEHLPPQMTVVGESVTINGAPAAAVDSVLPPGTLLSGYSSYYWLVDTPSGGVDLNPGDSLSLEIRVVCPVEGSYNLPLHTTTWYGDGDSFFAAGDSTIVTVTAEADITPPAAISNLSITPGN